MKEREIIIVDVGNISMKEAMKKIEYILDPTGDLHRSRVVEDVLASLSSILVVITIIGWILL